MSGSCDRSVATKYYNIYGTCKIFYILCLHAFCPAQQNITVTNRQLSITPFTVDRDPTNTANRWDKWKKDIERQFRCFGIHDPELKKDGLIIYGGCDINDLEDSLPDVESTDPPADQYTKFIRKLDKHFLPKKNESLCEIPTVLVVCDSVWDHFNIRSN